MFRKTFAFAALVCAAATVGFVSPAVAAADVANAPATAVAAPKTATTADGGVTIESSPTCSATQAWGKIQYQVCFRYNCDNDSCFTRGYLGLINRATSARTVSWELSTSDQNSPWSFDDSGTVTLGAGKQQTILSDVTWQSACDQLGYEALTIKYDDNGWSPDAVTSDFMFCT